jgi:hypothetical protein
VQVSERDRFDVLLEKLYAGFNMPMSKVRAEAYFDGLGKMSLAQFARCVESALGENGPERIPSVPGVWKISKELKHKNEPLPEAPKAEPDHLQDFANRLLWIHIRARGGLGSKGKFTPPRGLSNCEASPELAMCLKIKTDMVEFFGELIAEGSEHATPKEFVSQWVKELMLVSPISPKALAGYTELIADPRSKVRFAADMIRQLA